MQQYKKIYIVEEIVRHVGHLPELYEDVRSEKYKIYFCCFTVQVPVSWKRLLWIQMRAQMRPSLVSRCGFYIITSKVRYSPNISCTLALVLGSPCSSQYFVCRMTPCDLLIVYHIHAVWTLTRCGHLSAKMTIHHLCTEIL